MNFECAHFADHFSLVVKEICYASRIRLLPLLTNYKTDAVLSCPWMEFRMLLMLSAPVKELLNSIWSGLSKLHKDIRDAGGETFWERPLAIPMTFLTSSPSYSLHKVYQNSEVIQRNS